MVHPQSIVHSLVEYHDGSVLAELGNPDMRTPIAHALFWPDRVSSGVASLDLLRAARLDFEPADVQRFPCLRLGFEAARSGGAASAVLNAANEIAVEAFLAQRVRFTDIPAVVEQTLADFSPGEPGSLEAVLAIDAEARGLAESAVARLAARVA